MAAHGRVSELFCLVERYFGLDREALLSLRRFRHSAARAALATRMQREGFSFAEIGQALHRHPSTVKYLLARTAGYAKADPSIFPAFVGVTEAP